LFLNKPPTATRQSHSSVKFACPDVHAQQTKFPPHKRFWRFENSARRGRDEQPPLFRGLSWSEIRLHCTTSIAAALDGRRALRSYATACSAAGGGFFTVAAEFINEGWGMCEDQRRAAFLNEL
jgi:hypothetical protein